MSATRPDIFIPKDTWVDVYTAANIPVGTRIVIHNKGCGAVFIAESVAAPSDKRGVPLWGMSTGNTAQVTTGSVGVWALADEETYLVVQDYP